MKINEINNETVKKFFDRLDYQEKNRMFLKVMAEVIEARIKEILGVEAQYFFIVTPKLLTQNIIFDAGGTMKAEHAKVVLDIINEKNHKDCSQRG